jgi:two-component system, NtrC family, sensor kinase
LAYGLLFGAMIPAYVMILVLEGLFTGTRQYLLSLILLMAFVVFAGLLVNLKERLQLTVGKVFFTKQHDAYDALDHFSIAMRNILDLKALMERTLTTLSQALGIEKISIFLFDEQKDEYVLSAACGMTEIRLRTVRITSNHLLPQYLQETGQVLVKEELELNAGHLGGFSKGITGTLDDLESELCMPLRNQDRLIGLMNLGPKPNRALYTKDDLRNLSMLAASAASAFANASLHQQEKDTQRREKYTERAHAFETIAGGFAHEIRNPLVSIKTFLQLAPFRKDDPEFMESFRQIVINDTARIERLSGEVLGFARLHEPQYEEADLNNVVECALRSIETRAQSEGVALVFEKAPDLPLVWVDSQQLHQVFVNLDINALDAMEVVETRQLITKTRRLAKPDGLWIQIEITDTGTGIPPDTLDTIFVPFFTTKHESREREGTGLGLSICQRIVEAHGGYFEVKSKVGYGTTFYVNMPVHEPSQHRKR